MGISIWQLLILALVVVLIFGTRKLRDLGGDLGSAIKSFRGALQEGQSEKGVTETEKRETFKDQ